MRLQRPSCRIVDQPAFRQRPGRQPHDAWEGCKYWRADGESKDLWHLEILQSEKETKLLPPRPERYSGARAG